MRGTADPRPVFARRTVRRGAALAAVALLAVGALGACGSDDGDDAGSDEITTTEAGGDETTTTEAADTTTTSEAADDVVGTWTADAADILSSNTANTGGSAGLECTGVVTLDLRDDGTFAHSADATCTAPGGMSATATIDTTGTYEQDGATLRIVSAENNGSFEVMGTTQPMPSGLEGGAEATASVDGDTLTLSFTEASVGTVTQTYTRA